MKHLTFDNLLTIKLALESQAETYESMSRSLAHRPELSSFWAGNAQRSRDLAGFIKEQSDRLLDSGTLSIRLTAKL